MSSGMQIRSSKVTSKQVLVPSKIDTQKTTVAPKKTAQDVFGPDIQPSGSDTTTKVADSLTTPKQNIMGRISEAFGFSAHDSTISLGKESFSEGLNTSTDLKIVLGDGDNFKLMMGDSLYETNEVPQEIKTQHKAFFENLGSVSETKSKGSQLKIGSNLYLNKTTGQVSALNTDKKSSLFQRIKKRLGFQSTKKLNGVSILTSTDKTQIKSKLKNNITKCDFKNKSQVKKLKAQFQELKKVGGEANLDDLGISECVTEAHINIALLEKNLNVNDKTMTFQQKIDMFDSLQQRQEFLTSLDSSDADVKEVIDRFKNLESEFKDFKDVSNLKTEIEENISSNLVSTIIDNKISSILNQESLQDIKGGLTSLKSEFLDGKPSLKVQLEENSISFESFKENTQSHTSSIATDLRQKVIDQIETQEELSSLKEALSKDFDALENDITTINSLENSLNEKIEQTSLSADDKISLKTSFNTENKQISNTKEIIKNLNDSKLNLTKQVAKNTQKLMQSLNDSAKETIKEYMNDSGSLKFKETLTDFKKTFAKRFNYIKGEAMSANNVLSDLSGPPLLKKIFIGGKHNVFKKDTYPTDSLNGSQKGTLLENDKLDDIKDLYLEKKFESVYKSQVGSQYDISNSVDTKINDKLKELVGDIAQGNQNIDTITNELKSKCDEIFGGALDQISDFSGSEASGLIMGSFTKDAIFANLRGIEETVEGFTSVQQEMLVAAENASTDDVSQLEDLIQLSNSIQNFETFSKEYVFGKEIDVKMDSESLDSLFKSVCEENKFSQESFNMKDTEFKEFKQAFLDYSSQRLLDKGFVTEDFRFNQSNSSKETSKEIEGFSFKHDNKTLKTKIVSNSESSKMYNKNFSSKSGKPNWKAQFKRLNESFESKLKKKLQTANVAASLVQSQSNITDTLEMSKTVKNEVVGNIKLKLQTKKVQFMQATPHEKINILATLKEDINSFKEEIADGSQAREEAMETRLFNKTDEQLSLMEDCIDQINADVQLMGDSIDTSKESIKAFEANLNATINMMDSYLSPGTIPETSTPISASVEQKLEEFSLGELGNDVKSCLATISLDIAKDIGGATEAGKNVLENVLDNLSTIHEQSIKYAGKLNELSEELGGGVDAAKELVEAIIPGGKETLALLDIAKDLYDIRKQSLDIKQFKADLKAVSDMKNFLTESELTGNTDASDIQKRVDTFRDLTQARESRKNASLDLAVRLLNLSSPPQVAVGTVLNKVIGLCKMPDLSDEDYQKIAQDVNTINDGFSNLTETDSEKLKEKQKTNTIAFLEVLNKADSNQRTQKWNQVDSSTPLKKGEVIIGNDNKTYKKQFGYHDIAKTYQDFAYSMASSSQVSAGLKEYLNH